MIWKKSLDSNRGLRACWWYSHPYVKYIAISPTIAHTYLKNGLEVNPSLMTFTILHLHVSSCIHPCASTLTYDIETNDTKKWWDEAGCVGMSFLDSFGSDYAGICFVPLSSNPYFHSHGFCSKEPLRLRLIVDSGPIKSRFCYVSLLLVSVIT